MFSVSAGDVTPGHHVLKRFTYPLSHLSSLFNDGVKEEETVEEQPRSTGRLPTILKAWSLNERGGRLLLSSEPTSIRDV